MAYPRVDDLKVVFMKPWNDEELMKRKVRGPSYAIRPFPTLTIEPWMVSKRWFRCAAKAWMGAQSFDRQVAHEPTFPKTVSEEFLEDLCGLFFEYGRSVSLDSYMYFGDDEDDRFMDMDHCRSLRHVRIVTDESIFEPLDASTKFPWEEQYTDEELVAVLEQNGLGALRGLKSIDFVPRSSTCTNTPDKKAVFEANLQRLLEVARDLVSQPVEAWVVEQNLKDTDLYWNSDVRYGSASAKDRNMKPDELDDFSTWAQLLSIVAALVVFHATYCVLVYFFLSWEVVVVLALVMALFKISDHIVSQWFVSCADEQ